MGGAGCIDANADENSKFYSVRTQNSNADQVII